MMKRPLLSSALIILLTVAGATGQQTKGSSTTGAQLSSGTSAEQPPFDASNDPLLQPPPLPKGNPTLVGGRVSNIDKLRQSVVVKPFGGGSMKIFFDDRTHIYRDGVETTMLGIRRGDRVYVDTLLDGSHVFARNIRVETKAPPADARGQVVRYNAKDNRLEVRDELTSRAISFRIDQNTVVRQQDRTGTVDDLLPGALVAVRFSPVSSGGGLAREVDIYAAPGSAFTVAGKVSFLDMSTGLLALQNHADGKDYELHFDSRNGLYDNLAIGEEVTVNARFDGREYKAENIEVHPPKGKKF